MTKEDVFSRLVDRLLGYLDSVEILTRRELPDFISQFLDYEIWKTQWEFTGFLFVLILLLFVQILNVTYAVRKKTCPDECIWSFALLGLAGTFFLFCTAAAYIELKKLELAPKIYMLEKAKELLK